MKERKLERLNLAPILNWMHWQSATNDEFEIKARKFARSWHALGFKLAAPRREARRNVSKN